MTEARAVYHAPGTTTRDAPGVTTTRDEWEAAQMAKFARLRREHSVVRFTLETKDGELVQFSYEVVDRFHYRPVDTRRA